MLKKVLRYWPNSIWDILKNLYNFSLDLAPKLMQDGTISSNDDKLTLYSLYKQGEFGNACDQEGLELNTKFHAWKR